jgi:hypothetical protein
LFTISKFFFTIDVSSWDKPRGIKALLDHPRLGSPLPRGHRGDTPLHCALENSALRAAQILIEDLRVREWIDIENDEGSTPLMIAASQGHLEIVTKLVSLGAKPSKSRTIDGKNSFHLAKESGHEHVSKFILESVPEEMREQLQVSITVSKPSTKPAPKKLNLKNWEGLQKALGKSDQ